MIVKNKKILLIDPFCKNPKYESPNAKLGYSSAILEKAGIYTEIVDFIISNIEDIKELSEYEKMRKDYYEEIKTVGKDCDYIYINCEYGLLKTAREIAELFNDKTIFKL